MLRTRWGRVLGAGVLFWSQACSGVPLRSSLPGRAEVGARRPIPVHCVVAAPFEMAPHVRDAPADTPALLGSYLVEALSGQGVRVISGAELAAVLPAEPLRSERSSGERAYAQRIAFVADREFGCDVVATGRIDRFRDRSGEAIGSTRPSSVAFDLRFFGAPGGQSLWEGRFDETQKALTEDLWRASRYPGGGTRWLTAHEFARFGLGELVRNAPLQLRTRP